MALGLFEGEVDEEWGDGGGVDDLDGLVDGEELGEVGVGHGGWGIVLA